MVCGNALGHYSEMKMDSVKMKVDENKAYDIL